MKRTLLVAAAALAALAALPAQAQQRYSNGYAWVLTDPTKDLGAVKLKDGAGNGVTSTLGGGKQMLDVVIRDAATGLPVAFGGGGGGGGGGAVTVGDGADVTLGAIADAACASDNGSCTQMALIKRLNQRMTAAITALGSPAQAGAQATTNTSLASIDTKLSSQATASAQATTNTTLTSINTTIGTGNTSLSSIDSKMSTNNTSLGTINTSVQAHNALLGAVNETAPGTDVASSGLNGRLQRIAQNISSLLSSVNAAIPSGTADIGETGLNAHTSQNGTSVYSVVAANSNNSASIKGAAGRVYEVQAYGIHATQPVWVKLYNKATAPTCGTDTPVERHLISTDAKGGGTIPVSAIGANYALGIGICIVNGIADNDNTAVAASSYVVNIKFK